MWFYSKLAAIVLSIALICGLLYMFIVLPHTPKDRVPMVFGVFELLLFFLLIWVCIQQLRYLPVSVMVDTDEQTLEVAYCLASTQVLNAKQISSYATTTIQSKSGSYKGLLLTDASGRRILISEFSIKEIDPVVAFLEHEHVAYSGEEQVKLERYYKQARG